VLLQPLSASDSVPALSVILFSRAGNSTAYLEDLPALCHIAYSCAQFLTGTQLKSEEDLPLISSRLLVLQKRLQTAVQLRYYQILLIILFHHLSITSAYAWL